MYSVWPYEIEKWAEFNELTIEICHGKNREAALQSHADIIVTNPENIQWLFDQKYGRWGMVSPWFDILCIDESTKFKSHAAKRFKLLKKYLPYFERRWILTGTPLPNGIQDLWSQVYIMDQGRALGRYITHFRREFMYENGPYNWVPRPGAYKEIVDRVSPLVVNLDESLIDITKPLINDVSIRLDEETMDLYKTIENDFIAAIGEEQLVAGNVAAAGIKCRQIANGAVYLEENDWKEVHREKILALEDLVEELNGNPLLVLYEFRHDKTRIKNALGDRVAFLGDGDAAFDDWLIRSFNDGSLPVLAGHPASMGHGLNLQGACHHVCWFGITWNFEHYDQANRRIHRQGQTKRVTIHRLIAEGTLDKEVAETLKYKEEREKGVRAALEKAAARFSS